MTAKQCRCAKNGHPGRYFTRPNASGFYYSCGCRRCGGTGFLPETRPGYPRPVKYHDPTKCPKRIDPWSCGCEPEMMS